MPLPFILLLTFVLLSSGSEALAGDLVGKASIIDGDTLEIHGTRIRLWGIDAPKARSYAAMKTACRIFAERGRPMNLTPS